MQQKVCVLINCLFFLKKFKTGSSTGNNVNKCKWDAIQWMEGGIGKIIGMGFQKHN